MPEYAGPKQLRHLLDAVMSIASDLELSTVLERIIQAARDLVGAQYGALGVLDPSRTHLSQFITVGIDDDARERIGELPKGHGLLGVLIADPRPIRVPNLKDHPESFGYPPNHPPMTSFLGVPLYIRGEVFGNLYLTDKIDGAGFSDIDEELVSSLATAAAIAIENARLHEKSRELSLLADRERIGRDLHDTVVQRLFATGLAMKGTSRLAERADVRERLEQHINDIDDTIREIRSAIFELDISRLPGPSLRSEVLDVTAEAARVLGFEPVVHLVGPIDTSVTDEIAPHVVAVLREALSNVARHAKASRVDVTVAVQDHRLSVDVVDNGIGYSHAASSGNGIRNIARRARELGGRADIEPGHDGGTAVTWDVPLPA